MKQVVVSEELVQHVLGALESTVTYLRIEVNEARSRDAHVSTIDSWQDMLDAHRQYIISLAEVLVAPVQEPLGDEFAKVLHDNLWELYDNSTTPALEPVAFVSPDDLSAMHDPEYAEGAYFRMRKTPAGKYVQPVYTTPHKTVKLTPDQVFDIVYNQELKNMVSVVHATESLVLKLNNLGE